MVSLKYIIIFKTYMIHIQTMSPSLLVPGSLCFLFIKILKYFIKALKQFLFKVNFVSCHTLLNFCKINDFFWYFHQVALLNQIGLRIKRKHQICFILLLEFNLFFVFYRIHKKNSFAYIFIGEEGCTEEITQRTYKKNLYKK